MRSDEAEGRDRLLVPSILAAQFAAPFLFSGVAIALPAMGVELGAGATELGLVETLFLAGSLAFLLPVGRLADASDARTLYKIGMIGFALSALWIAASSSLPWILGLRFCQGVTAAIFGVTGQAIIAQVVPAEQRGRAYGASIGVIYAGLTLGPLGAGYLVDLWTWRGLFVVGALLLVVTYAPVHFRLASKWRRPERGAVHGPSVVLVLAAVLAMVAGTSALRVGLAGYALLALGIALAVSFVVVQGRVARPLVDVRAVASNAPLRSALLVQFLLYTNAFCSIFMLSLYMQVTLGRSAQTSGQVIALGSVLMAMLAPIAGALSDRFAKRSISGAGVACVLASTLLALTLDAASSVLVVGAVVAIQGIGFALFSSPNMAVIMNAVPAGAASMASALAAKSRSLGMVTGMLITALLVSLRIGNDPVAEHPLLFATTMNQAFTVLAVLSTLALFTAIGRRTAVSE
jgi:MFS family permease